MYLLAQENPHLRTDKESGVEVRSGREASRDAKGETGQAVHERRGAEALLPRRLKRKTKLRSPSKTKTAEGKHVPQASATITKAELLSVV